MLGLTAYFDQPGDPAPHKLLQRMHWHRDTLPTPLHRNVFEQRFESQISIGAEDRLRAGRAQEGQWKDLLGIGSVDTIPSDDVVQACSLAINNPLIPETRQRDCPQNQLSA